MFVSKIKNGSFEIKQNCRNMKRWGVFCIQRCGDCAEDGCNLYDGVCERGCKNKGYLYESKCTNDGGTLLPTEIEMPNLLQFRVNGIAS